MNKKYIVPIVTFISIYGFLWGLAQPLGLTLGFPLLLKVIVSTIVITIIYLLSDEIIKLKKIEIPKLKNEIESSERLELFSIDQFSKILLDIKEGTIIRIFASGSETYYVQFRALLSNINIKNLTINVLIRSNTTYERRRKVQEMIRKWIDLSKEHSIKINTYIYEFEFMLRGILIDDKTGILGLYHRKGGETYGQEYPFGRYSSGTQVGNILIKQSLKLFDSISSESIRNFRIKCFILDLHGTIIVDDRWAKISRKSAIEAISSFKSLSWNDSEKYLSEIMKKLKIELGYKASLTRAVEESGIPWNIWSDFQKRQVWPIDGLTQDRDLTDLLKKIRLYSSIIILTNNSRFLSNIMLVGCGISNYVDQLITRENMDEPKPNKEILFNIIKSQNIKPDECFVIGDRHVIDLELAKELGMNTILVSDSKPLRNALKEVIT